MWISGQNVPVPPLGSLERAAGGVEGSTDPTVQSASAGARTGRRRAGRVTKRPKDVGALGVPSRAGLFAGVSSGLSPVRTAWGAGCG